MNVCGSDSDFLPKNLVSHDDQHANTPTQIPHESDETIKKVYKSLKNDPHKLIQFIHGADESDLFERLPAKVLTRLNKLYHKGMLDDKDLELVHEIISRNREKRIGLFKPDAILLNSLTSKFPISELVYASESNYFRAWFAQNRGNLSHQPQRTLAIDVDPDVLQFIDRFISGHRDHIQDEDLLFRVLAQANFWQLNDLIQSLLGQMTVTEENVLDIYHWLAVLDLPSDIVQFSELKQKGYEFLEKNLNFENIDQILAFAEEHGDKILKTKCIHYITHFLPHRYKEDFKEINSLDDIYKILKDDPQKILLFLERNAPDETWRNTDLSNQFFTRLRKLHQKGRLNEENLKDLRRIIVQYRNLTGASLPSDFLLVAGDKQIPINRLTYAGQSDILRELLKSCARDRLVLSIDPEIVEVIDNYMNGRSIEIHDERLLFKVLEQANEWRLAGLVEILLPQVSLDEFNLFNIVRFAGCLDQINPDGRYARILNVLEQDLNHENVGNVYTFAKDYNLHALRNICIDYLTKEIGPYLSALIESENPEQEFKELRSTLKSKSEKPKQKRQSVFSLLYSQATGKPTLEEAREFLKMALSLLKQEQVLQPESLQFLKADELIALFELTPKLFKSLELKKFDDEDISRILANIPSGIEVLDLSEVCLGDKEIQFIAERCQLKKLVMRGTMKTREEKSKEERDQWLSIASINGLQELDVTGCRDLTVGDLSLLISQSPGLEVLRTGETEDFGGFENSHERLRDTDSLYAKSSNSSDFIADLVAHYCTQLKTFDLHPSFLTVKGIEHLLANKKMLEGLQHLDLSSYHNLDKDVYVDLIAHCPNLRSLKVVWDTPKTLLEISQHAPNLEYLNLLDNALKQEECEALAINLPRLKTLELETSEPLVTFSRFCPLIESLSLKGTKVSVKSAEEIFSRLKLVSFSLRTDQKIDPQFLHLLSQQSRLQSLKLDHFRKISDEDLAAVLSQLPGLKSLTLNRTKLGQKTLFAISKCVQLDRLDLFQAEFKGSSAYPNIFSQLKKLKYLNLKDTVISPEVIVNAVKNMPLLQSLFLLNAKDPTRAFFSAKSVKAILKAIPRIHHLSIKVSNAKVLHGLFKFKLLKDIEIESRVGISDEIKAQIENNPRLCFFFYF